jgi:hypothetical protein
MTLPHVLKRIRLNLARSKEFPEGSARRGYEFVAPLDAAGHIESALWQEYREHCRVHRFWDGEQDENGRLVHKPGGSEHARWVFHYEATGDNDEAGYRFAAVGLSLTVVVRYLLGIPIAGSVPLFLGGVALFATN